MEFKPYMEPFKIRSTEPIHFTTREERKNFLNKAHLNLFLIRAKNVIIDLLTDSGTGAMSRDQWAALMMGDESYAGSDSFFRFEESIQNITGMDHVIPTHQGRAAERILLTSLKKNGDCVVSNTLFDTTRANAELMQYKILDIPCKESYEPESPFPFKGNIDEQKLEQALKEESVACVILTITNNSGGSQPCSMENIKNTRKLCKQYKVSFVLDACRFAENSWFIKKKEKGYENKTPLQVAQETFEQADICYVSAKKDGLAHIGGFICTREEKLSQEFKNHLIPKEGFPTYGGLAGRDLESIAVGVKEALEEPYLRYRISSVKYLHDKLNGIGIPLIQPSGGHAIYIDAKKWLSFIPKEAFPGQAFAAAFYEFSGIRCCEIGSVMMGKKLPNGEQTYHHQELVRLAIPRRLYTISHLDYIADSMEQFKKEELKKLRGVKITYEPAVLRHFTAHFSWL